MPQVFICYRRSDNAYLASQLADHLADRFGRDSVFLDTESIQPGEDFRSRIKHAMQEVDVVLAIVGTAWKPERLRKYRDPVREELSIAYGLGKTVIPVLHSGQRMPTERELPKLLRWFCDLNAFEMGTPRTLHADFERLAQHLLSESVDVSAIDRPGHRTWLSLHGGLPTRRLTVAAATAALAGGVVFAAAWLPSDNPSAFAPAVAPSTTAFDGASASTTPASSNPTDTGATTATVASTPSNTSGLTTTVPPSTTGASTTTTLRTTTSQTATSTAPPRTTTTIPATTVPIRTTSLVLKAPLGLFPGMSAQSAGFSPSGNLGYAFGGSQINMGTGSPSDWVALSSPSVTAAHQFTTAAFSPDSSQFAAASTRGLVSIWDSATRRLLLEIPVSSPSRVVVFDWSPDGHWLVAADETGAVGVWSTITGAAAWTSPPTADDIGFRAVSWSPRNDRLAVATTDRRVLWLSPNSGKPLSAPRKTADEISDVKWSADGSTLAIATSRQIHLVDIDAGTTRIFAQPWQVRAVCFNYDGRSLTVAGTSLRTIELRSGSQVAAPASSISGLKFNDVSCSPIDRRIIAITANDAVIVEAVDTR